MSHDLWNDICPGRGRIVLIGFTKEPLVLLPDSSAIK